MEAVESDAQVIERAVADPSAFGVIYARHELAVRRYLARRVGTLDGEDLAVEVFTRAFRSRGRYEAQRESALPWLLGIASHVTTNRPTSPRRIEREAGILRAWRPARSACR